VVSINIYGESVRSEGGNNAVIQYVPDPPINLANDPTTTTDTRIRFSWTDSAQNGGSPVIDYDVYYDQGTGNYVFLQLKVLERSYLTTVTLTPGTTYNFKVTARNSVGSSQQSVALAVLAAKLPDPPRNLANLPLITTGYQVGLTWENGAYNGGSPEIEYQVSFAEETSPTYNLF